MRIDKDIIIFILLILFPLNLLGCRSIRNQMKKTSEAERNRIVMLELIGNNDDFIKLNSIQEEDLPDNCKFARSKKKQLTAYLDYNRKAIYDGFYPKFIQDEYEDIIKHYEGILTLINKYSISDP